MTSTQLVHLSCLHSSSDATMAKLFVRCTLDRSREVRDPELVVNLALEIYLITDVVFCPLNLQFPHSRYLSIKKATSGSKMVSSSSKATWKGRPSLTRLRTRSFFSEMEWALQLSPPLVSWQVNRWTNLEKRMSSAGSSFRGPRSLKRTTSTNRSQTPQGQQRPFLPEWRLTAVSLACESPACVLQYRRQLIKLRNGELRRWECCTISDYSTECITNSQPTLSNDSNRHLYKTDIPLRRTTDT